MIIGVDPHKPTRTATAVDAATNTAVASVRVAASAAGYRRLLGWAEQFPERRWAVENARGLGCHLAQWLVAHGETVLDASTVATARVRELSRGGRRKNDVIDASAAASVAALQGDAAAVAADDDTVVFALLEERRASLASQRVRSVNQLHALLRDLVAGGAPTALKAGGAAALLRSIRPTTGVERARKQLAWDLVREIRGLDTALKSITQRMIDALKARPSWLLDIDGVGPILAARLIGRCGRASRFPSADAFASYAGTAPVEVRGGDLHRWMRQIGHDGRLFKSASDPVEVHSMAQRLSSEERVRVDEMARAGVDVDEMARRLDRHRSTVHRELKRCGGRCGYDAEAAQAAADLRARRPKTPKLAGDPVLAAAVGGLLADRMSPHAISAQLRSEGHGICAETVYAACYDHSGARGLPEGSWKLLPRRCRKRRPRGRHARKPSPLGDFKAISQRPASVEDRRQPGHWEGDLIIGKANRSAVATLVERTSRQTLTVALPHGYDAHNTAAAVTAALARQPRHLVKTLTWDQGREMARWPDIEATLGIEVYFCDPHSPWQRPTNEQTNGLLRRWLPKSTDLNVGAVRLAIIEDHLNTMPRKLHDWNSAHSVYAALCRNHR